MAARRWSKGAVRALRLVERNRRGELRQAVEEIDRELAATGSGRSNAVKARILVELWRNGWAEGEALDGAQAFAVCGHKADDDDFYTHLIAAYSAKYRARSRGWSQLAQALSHYSRALESLRRDEPSNTDALRTVLIDRAETFVYLSQADVAVAEMKRALALEGKPQDWHVWAYAFALHQAGDYRRSARLLVPMIKDKPADDLYYNDMRLVLAASLGRADRMAAAQKTIREFRANRDAQDEPLWTITLELERGAFYPESPGEKHWRESLERLDPEGLPR